MLNHTTIQSVQRQLTRFAAQDNFENIITTAFGSRVNRVQLQLLRQQWRSANFSVIPEIQVLAQGELGTANGAYAADLDKIFVSSDFLARASESQVVALVLEEVGHRIDRLLNGNVDSAGDEGEIFSRLVNGQFLSAEFLVALKTQDDHGMITVGGRKVAIEQDNIPGTSGNDYLVGTSDNDMIYGYEGHDTLSGYSGNDYLYGGSGFDLLEGYAGNDYLDGSDGIDVLDGGSGFDTLVGGNDGDTYIISDSGDIIQENGNSDGLFDDKVIAYVSFTLNANVENISLAGSANINATGNSQSNSLVGNSGANILSGGDGNDTITADSNDTANGGSGNDYISFNISGVAIGNANVDGGTGDDDISVNGNINAIINGGDGNDYMQNLYVNNATVHGDNGDDNIQCYSFFGLSSPTIYGGNGNDSIGSGGTINGGAGSDSLYHLGGNNPSQANNVYVIDADIDFGIDTITEPIDSNGGIDTLDFRSTSAKVTVNLSATTNQWISAGVGLSGNSTLNVIENIFSGTGNDALTGNSLNNYILGGAGNDNLNGVLGDDSLDGGVGDDTINGGIGNDRLLGGAGNNFLIGGEGNDVYIIDADIDLGLHNIFELFDGNIDSIDLRSTAKDVTINLNTTSAQTVAAGVQVALILGEVEYAYGGSGSDNLTGNNLNNYLLGGAGNDTLKGGAGTDHLSGSAGADRFLFSSAALTGLNTVAALLGRDTISDFVVGTDKIVLSKSTFTAITSAVNGPIGTNFIKVANDTLVGTQTAAIVYSQSSGNLFYNQNGSAAGYGTGGSFAVLSGLPSLVATNFEIIA